MTSGRRGPAGLALAILAGSCIPVAAKSDGTMAPAEPPFSGAAAAPARALVLTGVPRQGGLIRGGVPAGTTGLTLNGELVPFDAAGRFLIGFDRDAGPDATLIATLEDGQLIRRDLSVAPVAWKLQALPTLPKQTPRTPEQLARRADEVARIAAARQRDHVGDGWRQPFLWPATGRISGVFGSQRIYAGEPGAYHGGVDIARPTGTAVVAPADGVVVLAAEVPFSLEGNLLMLDHGMGLGSAFLHLSRIDVAPGARVARGQVIGAVGQTGRATGPHLHWAMTWRGRRVDPMGIAGPMPSF